MNAAELFAATAQAIPGAVSFEARKLRMNQGKDGWMLTLVLHPNDVSPDLTGAIIGQQYTVLMVQCDPDTGSLPEAEVEEVPATTAAPAEKERRPFHTLPRSQQAAMRCQEPRFWAFLATQPGLRLVFSADEADAEIKRTLEIDSKRELNTDPAAAHNWDWIEMGYEKFRGQTTWERPS